VKNTPGSNPNSHLTAQKSSAPVTNHYQGSNYEGHMENGHQTTSNSPTLRLYFAVSPDFQTGFSLQNENATSQLQFCTGKNNNKNTHSSPLRDFSWNAA